MWFKHFETLKQFAKNNKYLLINIFINKFVVIIVIDYKKFFNKFRKKFILRKRFKIRFFEKFKNKIKYFDVKKINKLLQSSTKYKYEKITKKQRFLLNIICTNTLLCFSIFAIRLKYFNFILTKFYENI